MQRAGKPRSKLISLDIGNNMKSFGLTILLHASMACSVRAFVASRDSMRVAVKLFNLDKQFEKQLKSEYPDASRATILECDDFECAQAQCVQLPSGEWKCEGGLEGERGDTKKTVLMVSEDDD
ncbi:hypothetical protein HJC23_004983 [Cyclotella cryptica]|uniref:Uncharacterized protein n=1 Tax=Cyclotella cryptica TaxID=29204 RepID=A0ABD3P7I4_9STRA|eukprot:CCRYP_017078-RA/>CCRYP_017078-RA protein AED:0.19 eAED:0.19 QI:240/1/1/1/1/1/2/319/122